MKKLIVFLTVFAVFSGCTFISKAPPAEYEIEELPNLIMNAYEAVYGVKVTVNNLIGASYLEENNKTKINYLYEISFDDSFYHFYNTHQLSPEKDMIKNVREDKTELAYFKERILLTENNKAFISSVLNCDVKSLFWTGGEFFNAAIALTKKDRNSDDTYYERIAETILKKFETDYKYRSVVFVFVDDLSLIENSLYLEFYGMNINQVHTLIDTTIPYTQLTYDAKK